ncbi:GTPase HflX [Stappia sp. F7233]|uniref:GTPase HflX n=2 Tax=Stappia albiluteola TaxID=2758565 RepID=A0A839ABN0_9HYPH|nr:GTPase HflX [Stappia albiluteola]MBA5776586.1 GTPase HflX [Stappia albiluteola]
MDAARPQRTDQARLEEAVGLALAIDLEIVSSYVVTLSQIRPATLLGQGKVEELSVIVKTEEVELVVVDHPLTPIQQRNLEKALNAKVLDRTGLILEIFGARARTAEGRLQVELAHLKWQKSRLVRSWTHLERQRGGLGFIGGPGETQIEADRRLIQERITRLEKDLEQVRRTRDLHRKQRRKVPQPIVALVGYTNAGKSTLFNRLTRSDVFAKNLLFATLDPTLRRIPLPHGGEVILSDTVGFISDLPTHLVAAFRATLEEVLEADLILHVRDISHEDTEAQAVDVAETLRLLGIEEGGDERIIEVWNKIDLVDPVRREALLSDNARAEGPIAVSAVSGDGIAALLARIEDRVAEDRVVYSLSLPLAEGETLAWLYRAAEVLERRDGEATSMLTVRVPEKQRERFMQRCGGYLAAPGSSGT